MFNGFFHRELEPRQKCPCGRNVGPKSVGKKNPEGEFGLRRRRQAVQAPLAPAQAITQRV
jgi:hypothetical protein